MNQKISEAILEQSVYLHLELLLLLLHLLDQADSFLPLENLKLRLEVDCVPSLLCDYLNAIDLTEDLQVVPSDDLSTEIQLVFQLMVEHRQDSIVEFGEIALDLLRCRLWL